jgi:hypothetical protein
MGVFNYKDGNTVVENAIDKDPLPAANNLQIATTRWVKSRISEASPTGNCATGQTSSAGTSTGGTDTSSTDTSSTA